LGFICSIDWFVYGILLNDLAVIIPNGIGVLFSMINLIFYVIFRKNNQTNNEKTKAEDNKTPITIENNDLQTEKENININDKEKNLNEKIEKKEILEIEVGQLITKKDTDYFNDSYKIAKSDIILQEEVYVNMVKNMKNTL
jgi:hypothetical protein